MNRGRTAAPCMFGASKLVGFFVSYWAGRSLLEAVPTDLVCRVAPRLIANLGEYQEASQAGLRITRSRLHQVRGRGTGDYCDVNPAGSES